MYAVNVMRPEKCFIWSYNKYAACFNRAISGKKSDQVLTNQKFEKIRSRTVSIMRVFHWSRRYNQLYDSRVSCKSQGIVEKKA